jgi:hypothetical protein
MILKRTLENNYRRSTDLPVPPSRFVVVPKRRPREQRKVDFKKKQGVQGPKYRRVKKALHQKMIHNSTSERTKRKERNFKY